MRKLKRDKLYIYSKVKISISFDQFNKNYKNQ